MPSQTLAIVAALPACLLLAGGLLAAPLASRNPRRVAAAISWLAAPVSYTHLTLPTNREV